MACATFVGLLMSFTGVFGLGDDPAVVRTVYLVVACWVGAALAMLGYGAAQRIEWVRARLWARVVVADVLCVVPSAVLVWASTAWFGASFGLAMLPIFLLNGFVVWGAFIAAFVAPAMDAAARRERDTATAGVPRASFMDRLPPRLRRAELWALKAEDHYLRAITSEGEALIRLRLADALRELDAFDGARTHRSWWVARAAVRGVKRWDGKAALTLPDGREAPVSRSYARALRAARWL
ncbi:MAG TPA: LytTR family DNA-binding domain-containing protein [Gammaproteobacteria bacterium]